MWSLRDMVKTDLTEAPMEAAGALFGTDPQSSVGFKQED